jgi:hypothetical protein
MKSLIATLALMITAPTFAVNTSKVFRTVVPAEHTYVPKGFDSNDNVEIIVEGWLPNLCYKTPHAEVEVDGNIININMMAYSIDDGTQLCAEMIVPFIHTTSVGVLDKGMYTVVVNREFESQLFVDESTSDGIDDYVYANVEVVERVYGTNKVLLKGHNPSFCFEFEKFETSHNDKDVIAVQPIMKKVNSSCPMKMVPFTYEYEVPQVLPREKVLLHVRSMSGKSINSLFFQ